MLDLKQRSAGNVAIYIVEISKSGSVNPESVNPESVDIDLSRIDLRTEQLYY